MTICIRLTIRPTLTTDSAIGDKRSEGTCI